MREETGVTNWSEPTNRILTAMQYRLVVPERSMEALLSSCALIYVKRGSLSVQMEIGENKTLYVCEFRQGDFISCQGLLSMAGSPLRVSAMTLTEIGYLSKPALFEFMESDSDIGKMLFEWNEDAKSIIHLRLRDLMYGGKRGALAATLMRLASNFGEPVEGGTMINVRISQEKLAQLTGVTREYVTRALKQYEQDNVLSVQRRRIIIHNPQLLKEEHKCLDCPVHLCRI